MYSTSRPGFSCAAESGTISATASPPSEAPLQYQPKPAMDESNRWELSRYATLLFVLTVHAALLAWLVTALRAREVNASSSEPVQLLFIMPESPPKVRVDALHPHRLRSGSPLPAAPPALEVASSSSDSEPRSGSNGSGVDWAAEARRALQAFEIRSHQAPSNNSVSRTSPAEQSWWPRHRPGERFKMANGDWIVWVNSDCYQVAASAPSASHAATPAETVCPGESAAAGERTPPLP